jgi:hypothetical protein
MISLIFDHQKPVQVESIYWITPREQQTYIAEYGKEDLLNVIKSKNIPSLKFDILFFLFANLLVAILEKNLD